MGRNLLGFSQYRSVLRNESFQLAARNTARFAGVCIPLFLLVSLLLSLLMRAAQPGGTAVENTVSAADVRAGGQYGAALAAAFS